MILPEKWWWRWWCGVEPGGRMWGSEEECVCVCEKKKMRKRDGRPRDNERNWKWVVGNGGVGGACGTLKKLDFVVYLLIFFLFGALHPRCQDQGKEKESKNTTSWCVEKGEESKVFVCVGENLEKERNCPENAPKCQFFFFFFFNLGGQGIFMVKIWPFSFRQPFKGRQLALVGL